MTEQHEPEDYFETAAELITEGNQALTVGEVFQGGSETQGTPAPADDSPSFDEQPAYSEGAG